jgi:colicin import membrane protein
MARTESSVTVSLRQLMSDEEQRRKEEILAARRRQLEAERLEAEELARAEKLAREQVEAAAEAARQRAARQREEHVRLEAMREAELERARIAAELEARLAVISAQAARDEQELVILRDRRVRRLNLLASLFGAISALLLLGGVGLWQFSVGPAQDRLRADLARAEKMSLVLGEQAASERSQLRAELGTARARVAELERELRLANSRPTAPTSGPGTPNRRPVTSPPAPCTCNPRDPMCFCWERPSSAQGFGAP